jgi:hypothetical protein
VTVHAVQSFGEMAEWLKAQHWKCCLGVTLTRVRIPLSPFIIIAHVLCENLTQGVSVEAIVPGDVVILAADDHIPSENVIVKRLGSDREF